MKDVLVGIGCAIVLFISVAHYLELPVVYSDNLTNECVKVVEYGGKEGDCNNLPKKYYHEYVVRMGK